ncbi:hypothetical protein HRbin40_00605 [bacterium HR40]|nr:hypothetical protein HRbin40_00605 [bacterium HR40]
MQAVAAPVDLSYRLVDAYERTEGRVYLTGLRALVRLLLEQKRADRARGLETAGLVSGYRGSPLAGFDKELERARRLLEAEDIRFLPAINEALAATAVMGSQAVESEGTARFDGVFAMWYGKGPGLDWAGDAIEHANAYGTSPHGGVLAVVGDDHGAVSSSMSHQSDLTLASWSVPVLHPASLHDYLPFGLYGYALSRFCGAWVAFKAIAETVEGAASLELTPIPRPFAVPADFQPPPGGLHFRWQDPPGMAIEERLQHKLDAAEAFARVNPGIDRTVVAADRARLGIVAVGKAFGDVMEALRLMGFEEPQALARLGLRLYKVGQVFPLERTRILALARGLETLLVVEEKRPFVEARIKELLYDLPEGCRPRVIGKADRDGRELLPTVAELRPHRVAPVLAAEIERVQPGLDLRTRLAHLREPEGMTGLRRTPWFCPGCPHSRSTQVPEGARALAGIGCHIMAVWMDRGTAGITHMGGEGANWLGIAPFVERRHVFQNLGDGTYFHSGLLAIRQAVAAKWPITYRILFNDAVAMTGGQRVDGALDVPALVRQLRAEGVERVVVVSDEPKRFRRRDLPADVPVFHRRRLPAIQEELQRYPGVSVLVYDQTCAAEKRRRRKRGERRETQRRAFINELVCENCGDCSRQSSCLALVPVETEFGTKRQVDQSSCNHDFTCVEGFCPAIVTVENARVRTLAWDSEIASRLARLPDPELAAADGRCDILVTGVGGTGVLTLGAILGMAAHLEGRPVSVLDFTGLSQKGGAVLSHVRIADPGTELHQGRIAPGEARVVLACDLVVASSSEALHTIRPGRTVVVADSTVMPTAQALRDPDFRIDGADLLAHLRRRAGPRQVMAIAARRLATRLFGDAIAANMIVLGYAFQAGLLPVSRRAIERAIALNGVDVETNVRAFALGRLAAIEPGFVARLSPEPEARRETLEARVARLESELAAWGGQKIARDFAAFVARVAALERRLVGEGPLQLAEAVAEGLFHLTAIKDEYEVARLFVDGRFDERLRQSFAGEPRLTYHMAPPLLGFLRDARGRPRKLAFGPWLRPLLRLLARLRVLRGTPLDPFGHTAERRRERALLAEYRMTIETLLPRLDLANLEHATALARLPLTVRGFGPVRLAAIERYREKRRELLERFATASSAELPLAAE